MDETLPDRSVAEVTGLGHPFEVIPTDSSIHGDWIDYTLRPSPPQAPSLCVEAKELLSSPPRDRSHEEIEKGLKQSEARGSGYFVWTNGDTWQLFSLKLPDAPIYEINIGLVGKDEGKIQQAADWLRLLSRETLVNNPHAIDEQITVYWKRKALPEAFTALSEGLAGETIKLMKSALPDILKISPDEILKFLKECHRKATARDDQGIGEKTEDWFKPCLQEWEKLVTSHAKKYMKARDNILEDANKKKLVQYLVSDEYEPFPKSVAYSLLGFPKRGKETKGPVGSALGYLKTLGFIEVVDPQSRGEEVTYKRVDEAMPYLKRILQSK